VYRCRKSTPVRIHALAGLAAGEHARQSPPFATSMAVPPMLYRCDHASVRPLRPQGTTAGAAERRLRHICRGSIHRCGVQVTAGTLFQNDERQRPVLAELDRLAAVRYVPRFVANIDLLAQPVPSTPIPTAFRRGSEFWRWHRPQRLLPTGAAGSSASPRRFRQKARRVARATSAQSRRGA
jgi:hypothetical protein